MHAEGEHVDSTQKGPSRPVGSNKHSNENEVIPSLHTLFFKEILLGHWLFHALTSQGTVWH